MCCLVCVLPLLQLDKAAADASEFKAGFDKLLVDTVEQKAQVRRCCQQQPSKPLASAQSLLCRCVLVLAQPCFLPGLYGGAGWLLHCLVVQSLVRCGSMLVRVQQLRGATMLRMPTLTHVSACAGCTFAAGQGLSRCC